MDDVRGMVLLPPGLQLLIDLLRQVADAATNPATARSARQAADLMFRGVVSASSVIP